MADPKPCAPKKAMILYDAECSFCCDCVYLWKRKGRVEFLPAARKETIGEGIRRDGAPDAVILIEASGESYSGAAAIIRFMLIEGSRLGLVLWWLYERLGLFRWVAGRVYAVVARLRRFL